MDPPSGTDADPGGHGVMDGTVPSQSYHEFQIHERFGPLGPALLALAGLLCGPAHAGDAATAPRPWIEAEPPPLAARPDWTHDELALSFDLEQAAEIQRWTVRNGELDPAAARSGLVLRSTGRDLQLVRPVEIDAASVDALQLWMSPLPGGVDQVEIFWGRGDQPDAPERGVRCATVEGPRPHLRCPVSEVPTWRGRVERIRVDPTLLPGRRIEIDRIDALRLVAEGIGEDATAEPARVTIDDETRWALVAVPGRPLWRDVEVPESGATLTLAWALSPVPGGTRLAEDARARLRVIVEDAAGARRRIVDADVPWVRSDAWRPLRADLVPFAGRRVRVGLHVAPPDGARGDGGALPALRPCWANPTVVPTLAAGSPRPPSVLLVSVDTLRADRTSLYGHDRPTTPRIDAWAARRGVVFEHAFAAAPWTLPSHTTMLTGLDAVHHGVNHHDPAPASLRTLAERFRSAGYATAAVTGGGYLHPRFRLDQGFETFRWWQGSRVNDDELGQGLLAASRLLDEVGERPFFLFLHTYAVHTPFRAHEPYRGLLAPGTPPPRHDEIGVEELVAAARTGRRSQGRLVWQRTGETLEPLDADEIGTAFDLYDSGVALADSWIGAFLETLRARGLEERTIVVLTSDHGEQLGEGGGFGHRSLDTPVLRVPLVIAPAGRDGAPGPWRRGTRVRSMARTTDIVPTLLELTELPDGGPGRALDGVSLAPALRGEQRGAVPPSFAYAAATNFGASLRLDDGTDFRFDNTAFRAEEEREELEAGPDAPPSEALRDRLLTHLEERHALRLRFTSRPDAGRELLVLGGTELPGDRVKIGRHRDGSVEWMDPGVRVVLPPGSVLELELEGAPDAPLWVEVGGERRRIWPPLERDGDTRRSELRADGSVIVEARWTGPRAAIGVPPPGPTAPDPDLEEQLKALGYVD